MDDNSDKNNKTDKPNDGKEVESTDKENKQRSTERQATCSKKKVQYAQETENLISETDLASCDRYPGKQCDVIFNQSSKQGSYPENGISRDFGRSTPKVKRSEYTEESTMDSTDAIPPAIFDEQNNVIKVLKETITEKDRHSKEINEELKRCRDENTKLTKEIKEFSLKHVQLTGENDNLKKELQKLTEDLTQEKRSRVQEDKQVEQLKSSNNELERGNRELQQKYTKLKETLDELQKKYHENTSELSSKHGSNVDLLKRLDYFEELKGKLEKDVDDLRYRESTLSRANDDLKNQVKDLTTELSKTKDIASKQSTQIRTLTDEKKKLEEEIKRLKNKGTTTTVNSDLLAEIETLKRYLSKEQESNKSVHLQLTQTKGTMKTANESLLKEIETLKSDLNKEQHKSNSLNLQLTKTNDQFRKNAEEKNNFQSWYNEGRKNLKTANGKITDLENEKKILEASFSRFKQDSKKTEDDCQQLKTEKRQLIHENEKHQKEEQLLRQQVADISSNIDSLKEQKENFQTWFHDAEKAKRAADEELKKTKETLLTYQKRYLASQTSISEKETEIRRLSKENAEKENVHKEQLSRLAQSFDEKEKMYIEGCQQLQASIQEWQLQHQYQEEECKQHTAELQKMKQENLVLTEFVPMHKQQLQQLEDEKNELTGKFENMKNQKEQFQKRFEESDKAQRNYLQQVKEAGAILDTFQVRIQELEYTLSVKEGNIIDITNKANKMEENYKSEIQEKKELIDKLKVELKEAEKLLIPVLELKEEKDRLQHHLDCTKNEFDQTLKAYSTVNEQVTHILRNLKEKRIECTKYQEQNNKLKRCNELLTQQVKSLQDSKESLLQDLMQNERQRLGFREEDDD